MQIGIISTKIFYFHAIKQKLTVMV